MISFPNAKINIGLSIIEKRQDNFHNIESIFYPVPLCDVLEVLESNHQSVDVVFESTGIKIPGDPSLNLCVRAYNLLRKEYTLPKIKIHLHKVIPIGAGLGGGSADAAFFLNLLNEKFRLNILKEKLELLAGQLGSDCVFFIKNKPAFVTGKGENIESVDFSLRDHYILIVYPDLHISTAEAYSLIKPQASNIDLRKALHDPSNWKEFITNDFESPLVKKYPVISEIKAQLYKEGAYYVSMTGSGSAVYGLFTNEPRVIETKYFTWKGKLN